MTSLPVTCSRRTRLHTFTIHFCVCHTGLTRTLSFVLSELLLCLSVLAQINQHNGKIFPDRYRWYLYGTLLMKVLYRAPSLFKHTELRTDLMHEGLLLVLQSVLRPVCCDKQIFVNPSN